MGLPPSTIPSIIFLFQFFWNTGTSYMALGVKDMGSEMLALAIFHTSHYLVVHVARPWNTVLSACLSVMHLCLYDRTRPSESVGKCRNRKEMESISQPALTSRASSHDPTTTPTTPCPRRDGGGGKRKSGGPGTARRNGCGVLLLMLMFISQPF